jgi:hypothetical protein
VFATVSSLVGRAIKVKSVIAAANIYVSYAGKRHFPIFCAFCTAPDLVLLVLLVLLIAHQLHK